MLDVRLEEDLAKTLNLIPGSTYRNPDDLPNWISQLDKSKEVVVYCLERFGTALKLRCLVYNKRAQESLELNSL